MNRRMMIQEILNKQLIEEKTIFYGTPFGLADFEFQHKYFVISQQPAGRYVLIDSPNPIIVKGTGSSSIFVKSGIFYRSDMNSFTNIVEYQTFNGTNYATSTQFFAEKILYSNHDIYDSDNVLYFSCNYYQSKTY